MSRKPRDMAGVPRFALTLEEAAHSLGMSVDSYDKHVRPHVKTIRKGKLVLTPTWELERWATENADTALRHAA